MLLQSLASVSKMLALLTGVWYFLEFERLRVCVRTAECWSQNFSERGVGSGWRRGGMAEDLYVCEDRGWCCLVVLVGGYLLVYFFLWFDLNSMENKGVQCWCRACAGRKFCTGK